MIQPLISLEVADKTTEAAILTKRKLKIKKSALIAQKSTISQSIF
jgi:hypothetical protein